MKVSVWKFWKFEEKITNELAKPKHQNGKRTRSLCRRSSLMKVLRVLREFITRITRLFRILKRKLKLPVWSKRTQKISSTQKRPIFSNLANRSNWVPLIKKSGVSWRSRCSGWKEEECWKILIVGCKFKVNRGERKQFRPGTLVCVQFGRVWWSSS